MNYRSTSSGKLSASQVITAIGGYVLFADLLPPSDGTSILRIYDSPIATTDESKILAELWMDAGYIPPGHSFNHPVSANTGIYAELDQTNSTAKDAEFIVHYSAGI